ncbi:MAG TPA: sugar ABC transporter permease [Caproicibacter sp.]|nr:sugar ABC transporter permease [Caproicibacter sp.]
MNIVKKFLYSQKVTPYIFILPFIITFCVFFIYPVYLTVRMSFQSVLPGQEVFIGLANYRELLKPTFILSIIHSVIYTVLTLILLIPIPMILACCLNSKIMKARNFFRATLFIPALTSVVVAGTIFRLIFGELPGSLMNGIVAIFGIPPQKWLQNSVTGFVALLCLALWRWTGVNILYFLSGLQNIPNELYESAEIDGASTLKKFTKITLPMLKPMTIYVLTISIYGGMSMFTESYMLWSGNRSPQDIGLTIVGYLYRCGWEQNNMGLGSAVGIVLLLFTFIVNMLQLNFFGIFKKEDN